MLTNVPRFAGRRRLPQSLTLKSFSTEKPSTALYTWGIGTNGQLGHAKFTLEKGYSEDYYIQEEPRRLLKSKTFTHVAVGGTYTLALNDTGHLFGWGERFDKKHQSNIPQILPDDRTYKHVSAGAKHAAAVGTDGQVYTWGYGGGWFQGGGQLGHDSYDSIEEPKLVEGFQKYGDAKAAATAVGEQHTVILTIDGETLGCGVGEFGRVGNGSTSDVKSPACLDVLMDEDIIQVVTGTHHTLVLTADGKIYSWGKNDTGALGHADSHIDMYSLEEYPRLLECAELSDNVAYVSAGSGRSAAVTTDGRLFLWGRNMGHIPAALSGTAFDGLKVTKVALGGEAGKSVIAIITEDGGLWCYGDASSKMLGSKVSSGRHPEPVRVPFFKDKKVLDIYCGPGQHIVAKVLVDNE